MSPRSWARSYSLCATYNGHALLDLPYQQDSKAQVDLNVVANGDGHIIEVQGTAEGAAMKRSEMDSLVDLALEGVAQLVQRQKDAHKKAGVRVDGLFAG